MVIKNQTLPVQEILALDRYPLDQPKSAEYIQLVQQCRQELNSTGMFNLPGFLMSDACETAVRELLPIINNASFTHKRSHNIYFQSDIPGLESHHPALRMMQTINHTICADQMIGSRIIQIYEYAPLLNFLADVMEKAALYLMEDPLARVNVMAYRDGEALNWHFDRSEFTTTLLLQAPLHGGQFEYRSALRSSDDQNYEGVARVLAGDDPETQMLSMSAGTLNVFRGINTAHRVTPVRGVKERIVAVFSYYEESNRHFSTEELIGFYGRAR